MQVTGPPARPGDIVQDHLSLRCHRDQASVINSDRPRPARWQARSPIWPVQGLLLRPHSVRPGLCPQLVHRAGPGPAGRTPPARGAYIRVGAGNPPLQALHCLRRFSASAGYVDVITEGRCNTQSPLLSSRSW